MNQSLCINWHTGASLSPETLTMTVFRGHARFDVRAALSRLRNTPFGSQLQRQSELKTRCLPPSDPLTHQMYKLCLPVLERLAPQTTLHDLSLERFLHTPHYHLELVSSGKSGEIRIQGHDRCSYAPAFGMAPLRAADLPDACSTLPRVHARSIRIAPALAQGESVESVQGRVVTTDGTPMYFKPRIERREPDFKDELLVLMQVRRAGPHERLRAPEVQGIVVSGGDGGTVVGMLLDMVVSLGTGTHMTRAGMYDDMVKRATETMQEVHARGLMGGDVRRGNFPKEKASPRSSWMDFSGPKNVEINGKEKHKWTVEGDWQGSA